MEQECQVYQISCTKLKSSYPRKVPKEMFHRNLKSMFQLELDNAIRDRRPYILHYAVIYGNPSLVRQLLDQKSEVNIDEKCSCGKTPLMLAIKFGYEAIVDLLLAAKASIYVVDSNGQNALDLVFSSQYNNTEIRREFYHKLKSSVSTTEELAETLRGLGCSLYRAFLFNDTHLSKCMLAHTRNVDSADHHGRTALHAAAKLDDLKLVEWLVHKGADVNTLDRERNGALYNAASKGNAAIVEFLLTRKACPNELNRRTQRTPLSEVFAKSEVDTSEKYDECARLLLQYGAIPHKPKENYALRYMNGLGSLLCRQYDEAGFLVAHFAILEMLGMAKTQPVMFGDFEKKVKDLVEFEKLYAECENVLKTKVFRGLSLFDLLTIAESKIRNYTQNEDFESEIMRFDANLKSTHQYYSDFLMRRVRKASRMAVLEDAAILVICRIFGGHYVVAKRIVGYLSEFDLKKFRRLKDVENQELVLYKMFI